YIDNAYQVYDPFTGEPDSSGLQFDGFTTLLEAKAKVIAGQTYHLRMAIADVKDKNYDSGVFLESGSFKSEETKTVQKKPVKKESKKEAAAKRHLSTRTLSVNPP